MKEIAKYSKEISIIEDPDTEIVRECSDLSELTDEMLADARMEITNAKTLTVPIADLALLGAGVSSLIPALRTVTQTSTINTTGLYQLANKGIGDVLKEANNGNFWGAFKTLDGGSKFAQLQKSCAA